MERNNKRLRANPNFIMRDIAGEVVLIPIGDAGIFENSVISLNKTGCYLWQLFQEPRTVEDVVAKARQEYFDPEGKIEKDIKEFIVEYRKYGLLKEE